MRDDALPMARIVLAGVAVVLTVAIAVGAVLAILAHRHVPVGGIAIDKPSPLDEGLPMLQSAPQPDLAAYQAAKRQALDSARPLTIAAAMAQQAASTASAASAGAAR